jgi:hypothetical protein
MRRVAVILGLLALLLPMTVWASGIDLVNKNGTVTITNAGIVSQGSHLIRFNGITAPKGHALGSVSFSTGALVSGDIWNGGTFSDVGSSFIVTGTGNYGEPKGVIFSGSFVGPIVWTLIDGTGKPQVYQLSGTIQGQLWTGRTVTGTTVQTIYAYKRQELVDHKGNIGLGNSHLNTPEPGTLGLLGTGLIALAATMRRKVFGA